MRAAPTGGYVELELDGAVPELPPPRTLLSRLRSRKGMTLSELRQVAAELAEDGRPAGLLVVLRGFDGGMASALALRDVLARVRRAGRRVVVHVPGGVDTKGYFIASVADRITVFPGGSVGLLGFASRGVFVRRALAKLGVVAEVLARGKYKSAGDALTQDAMTEPQREQTAALLDVMHATVADAVAEGRGLTRGEVDAAIDRAVFRTPEAVAAKLVDAALFDDEVGKMLASLASGAAARGASGAAVEVEDGSGKRPETRYVPAARYLRARQATALGRGRGGPCVGVVRVHGMITQGKGSLGGRGSGAAGDVVIAAVRAARENPRVRGVLLHIDSPGGSALASAQMHRELALLAADKPLVAVMGNVAASGGYYVAAPAHAIVAQPVTITGSIGVIAARFALGPFLERLGVTSDIEQRGARADLFGMMRPLTADERAALMDEIEGTYQEFIGVVAEGRKRSRDEVEALAQGRVWSGADAHARGLVDRLGGFEVGLEEVRRRIGEGATSLPAREVKGAVDGSLRAARPGQVAAWQHALDELLGPWAGMVPLTVAQERVLAWAPDAMGLGDGEDERP